MIERIKMILKRRKITQGKMLSDCGMGKNTLARILEKSDGEDVNERDILLQNFVKIADYLDCSADFLLGRSNVPEINGRTASFISNISDFDDAVLDCIHRLSPEHNASLMLKSRSGSWWWNATVSGWKG